MFSKNTGVILSRMAINEQIKQNNYEVCNVFNEGKQQLSSNENTRLCPPYEKRSSDGLQDGLVESFSYLNFKMIKDKSNWTVNTITYNTDDAMSYGIIYDNTRDNFNDIKNSEFMCMFATNGYSTDRRISAERPHLGCTTIDIADYFDKEKNIKNPTYPNIGGFCVDFCVIGSDQPK